MSQYIITDGKRYIFRNFENRYILTYNESLAEKFDTKELAEKVYKNSISKMLKKSLSVQEYAISPTCPQKQADLIEEEDVSQYKYTRTDLEKDGFDIVEFFKKTIKTVSQLKKYADNMIYLEKECDKKINDIRHYKRDKRTKLNAIQLQRLEQFEIQIEKERYEYKSNRIIAKMFLSDLNRIEDPNYVEIIKNVKESEYKPKILTYEILDEIVGKTKKAV